MQYKTFKKVRVATGATGAEFEEALNNILAELQRLGAKYDMQFNTTMGHCAYITYTYTQEIAETIKEEYELRGECYECKECPFFQVPTDGRTKYSFCPKSGHRTTAQSSCCEYFYRAIANGEVKPCFRN